MKTTDFIKENKFIGDDAHAMHQDHEVQMARSDCYNAAKYAIELHKLLKNISEMEGLDGWVSEKITLANDYLRTVAEYLRHQELEQQNQMSEVFTAESANAKFAELLGEDQNVAEAGKPDVMRHTGDKTVRVVKKGGKPVGEIGIDAGPGGNGDYYVKLYDGSYDAAGFDTAEEALEELRYAVKQMSEGPETGIGSKLPKSDIETFGLQKGRPYKLNPPQDWKPGDRKRAVQQLIPTQDKKDHIRSRLGKHVAPVLPEQDVAEGSLEEIDRRGFLKGAGAAAVAGAAGYKMGRGDNTTPTPSSTLSGADLRDPRVSYIIGFFYWCLGPFEHYKQQENRESLKIQQDIKKWIKDWDAEENHWDKGLDNNEKSISMRMRKERQLGQKEAYDWFYHEIYKESDPKGTFERFMSRVKYEHSKLLNWNKSRQESVQQGVAEGAENNPVVNAITRRIMLQRTDLLSKYGPEKVGQAIDEVADFVGDVEEIGSSDVSGWIRHVEQMLGNMSDQSLAETTSAGGVATVPGVGGGPKVGSLFGGSYSPKTPFTGKKKAKESVIKR